MIFGIIRFASLAAFFILYGLAVFDSNRIFSTFSIFSGGYISVNQTEYCYSVLSKVRMGKKCKTNLTEKMHLVANRKNLFNFIFWQKNKISKVSCRSRLLKFWSFLSSIRVSKITFVLNRSARNFQDLIFLPEYEMWGN